MGARMNLIASGREWMSVRRLATFALLAPVVWLGTTLLTLLTPAVPLALRLAQDGFGLSPDFGAGAWASGLVLTVSSGILVLGLVPAGWSPTGG